MSKILNTMQTQSKLTYDIVEKYSQNPYIAGAVVLLTLFFSNLITPEMPLSLAHLLSHPLVKILLIILILVVRKYSSLASLLITILFIISMQSVTKTSLQYITNNIQSSMEKAYKATKNNINEVTGTVRHDPTTYIPTNYEEIQSSSTINNDVAQLNPLPQNSDSSKYGSFPF